MKLVITQRDQALVRTAWSLGYATSQVLRTVVSPQTQLVTLRPRLRRLVACGQLRQTRVIGGSGHLYLYGAGSSALPAGSPSPWRPGLSQLGHTIAVGETLVAFLRPDFGGPGLDVVGWQGEAEIRSWVEAGAPIPDLRVRCRSAASDGWWNVEMDRATESRAAWRRKLTRYLAAPAAPVLTVTTSPERARALAHVAADLGVPAWITTTGAVRAEPDPWVFDAAQRRRCTLTAAATATPAWPAYPS